ncbi:MAG TPA: hypothetical protein PK871_03810, partial [Mycobacterium sp.]|nr:hypothetical protein [Mycobacterium sp.]
RVRRLLVAVRVFRPRPREFRVRRLLVAVRVFRPRPRESRVPRPPVVVAPCPHRPQRFPDPRRLAPGALFPGRVLLFRAPLERPAPRSPKHPPPRATPLRPSEAPMPPPESSVAVRSVRVWRAFRVFPLRRLPEIRRPRSPRPPGPRAAPECPVRRPLCHPRRSPTLLPSRPRLRSGHRRPPPVPEQPFPRPLPAASPVRRQVVGPLFRRHLRPVSPVH